MRTAFGLVLFTASVLAQQHGWAIRSTALKSRSRFVQAAVSAGEYTTKKFSHSLPE
jgi:hypothetical protein